MMRKSIFLLSSMLVASLCGAGCSSSQKQASATDYAVYNSLGQLLRTGHFEGGRLSVSVPDRGVYFVKLHTAGLDFTQKVLIGR